jgi:hypothetical protein
LKNQPVPISPLHLNQDNFKEIATFESAIRPRVVFTDRHQVNDASLQAASAL